MSRDIYKKNLQMVFGPNPLQNIILLINVVDSYLFGYSQFCFTE